MKKLVAVLLVGVFLSGCALLGPKTDSFDPNRAEMEIASLDLGINLLYGSFLAFCQEGIIDKKSCGIGDEAKKIWDSNFTVAMNAIMEYRQGALSVESTQAVVNSLTKLVIEINRMLKKQDLPKNQEKLIQKNALRLRK